MTVHNSNPLANGTYYHSAHAQLLCKVFKD